MAESAEDAKARGRFRLTYPEADALRGAIEACEALWDLDLARGLVPERSSEEYRRICPTPRLHRMLDKYTEADP